MLTSDNLEVLVYHQLPSEASPEYYAYDGQTIELSDASL